MVGKLPRKSRSEFRARPCRPVDEEKLLDARPGTRTRIELIDDLDRGSTIDGRANHQITLRGSLQLHLERSENARELEPVDVARDTWALFDN